MLIAVIIQSSLFERPSESVIVSATDWMVGLVTGTLATTVAVIAIAWVGFAMFSGRIDVKRGLTVVLGCFLLFGARSIAEGLTGLGSSESSPPIPAVRPPFQIPRTPPSANTANAFDPYAGADTRPPAE